MNKKVLTVLIGLTITLSMVLGILAGCGTPATPTATVTPTGTATGKPTATAKPTTTAAPTPLKAGEVIKWRCQSFNSAGSPNFWLQKEFAENVKIASGGRLVIDVLPVGSILGTYEIFDGVGSGAIESGVSCDPYWSGNDMRFELQGMIAGHFTPMVQIGWFFGNISADKPIAPGWQYAEELFGKFNIKPIPFGISETEAEYMANKPIIKPSDYKGLTFRGTGWTTMTVQEPSFGAKGVFVPSQDVYSSLQTGVIDACELGNLASNYVQGYYDICKYTGFPGIHKLGETCSFMVNMATWKKTPADLQKIVEACAHMYGLRNQAFARVQSAQALPEVIKKGVTVTYTSPEAQNMWRTTSWALSEKEAAKSPEFKKMWEDMKAFQIMMDRYVDLQTPDYGPDYEGNKEKISGIKFQ